MADLDYVRYGTAQWHWVRLGIASRTLGFHFAESVGLVALVDAIAHALRRFAPPPS